MPDPLVTAYDHARAITRQHAKTFYFCSFGLPQAIRNHAYAVYACCRTIDDEVDRAPSSAAIPEIVGRLRGFLDDLYTGTGRVDEPPWAPAFRATVARCDIPKAFFSDLLTGVEMDQAPVRIRSWAELERYCYHVAGVVGLMMTRVFHLQDRNREAEALKLGEAMQLTNILRDVAEDLRLDRIYLPADELAQFGLDEAFLRRGQTTPEWSRFMRFQIERARASYAASERGIAALDPNGCRFTVWMMHHVYGGILDEVERADYDVFSARRFVPLPRKFALAVQAFARSRSP